MNLMYMLLSPGIMITAGQIRCLLGLYAITKKDGGRFTNTPAIGPSAQNFHKVLKEALLWTPASAEDVKKYGKKLYASHGVEVTHLGKVKAWL